MPAAHGAPGARRRARAAAGAAGSARSTTRPAAAASIGQVHRGRLDATAGPSRSRCSTPAPGQALISDLNQVVRVARVVGRLDPRPRHQAAHGRAQGPGRRGARLRARGHVPGGTFAAAFAGDADVRGPRRRAPGRHTSWSASGSTACRCRAIIASGTTGGARPRQPAATWSSCSPGPQRAGLLHADPHPGNFRLTADGRLGVLDFGAVNRLPDGLPARHRRAAHAGPRRATPRASSTGLREEGFIKPSIDDRRPRRCSTTSARSSTRCASETFTLQPGVAARRCSATSTTRAGRSSRSA